MMTVSILHYCRLSTDVVSHSIAITVNFSQAAYNVDENSQNLPITLIFSNPSSTPITVGINSSPQTVTSKYIHSYVLHINTLFIFLQGILIMILDHTLQCFLPLSLLRHLTLGYLTITLLKHQRLLVLPLIHPVLFFEVTLLKLQQPS